MAEWWYATEDASILLSKNVSVLFLKYSTKNWWLIYFICSYHFMFKCWHLDPKIRPTFSELVSLMSQTLENLASYTQVSTFGISEAHDENFYFDIGDYCKSESKLHWYFVFPRHSYSIMWKLEPSIVSVPDNCRRILMPVTLLWCMEVTFTSQNFIALSFIRD